MLLLPGSWNSLAFCETSTVCDLAKCKNNSMLEICDRISHFNKFQSLPTFRYLSNFEWLVQIRCKFWRTDKANWSKLAYSPHNPGNHGLIWSCGTPNHYALFIHSEINYDFVIFLHPTVWLVKFCSDSVALSHFVVWLNREFWSVSPSGLMDKALAS